MFKGIIFDLDGTIADTLPLCIEAFRRSIEPLAGRTLSDEEIIATFGPSEEGTIMALIPSYYEQGLENYLLHYEQLHSMCPEPFEGILPLMEALDRNQIRMAMVTGKGKHSTDISLKVFALAHRFEIIETGSPHGPRKSDGIQIVLSHWNEFKPEEVLYVGDAPGDIIAARKAGIPVAAAGWAATADPEALKSLQPDYYFEDTVGFSQWILGYTQ